MQTGIDPSLTGTLSASLAAQALCALQALGVKEIIVCAGARNAPLVLACDQKPQIKVFRFFEERSAAFFALGRSRESDAPVAVITTSGTAVAECLPAVIEAFYQGRPLLILSADRPRNFRGTGAPQSIEQPGMFGQYAPTLVDIEAGEVWPSLKRLLRPVHWNLGFPEPLGGPALTESFTPRLEPPESLGPVDLRAWTKFLGLCRKPFVILGPLLPAERAAARAFLNRTGLPCFAESLSGLAGIHGGDPRAGEGTARSWLKECDGVLRLGGVPTSRLWREVEDRRVPILSLSGQPWSGTPAGDLICGLLGELLSGLPIDDSLAWKPTEKERDFRLSDTLTQLYGRYPKSEPALVREWGMSLDPAAHVYVGNSLPVREWELFARGPGWAIPWASRGANGIDGQISTFLGGAKAEGMNYALLGDLTALYDLAGFWGLRERPVSFQLALLNNGGGRIFGRLFKDERFENRHGIRFAGLAQMWDLPYQSRSQGPFDSSFQGLLEIVPNEIETQNFWAAWEQACRI